MKRVKDNIIGVVGVFASIALTVIFMAAQLLAGPRILHLVRTPLNLFVESLSPIFPGGDADRQALAFCLYVLLFALLSIGFAWPFWLRTSSVIKRTPFADHFLLMIQIIIAVTILPQQPHLLIVAVELAFVLPLRSAFCWLAAQMVAFIAMQIPYLFGMGDWLPVLDLSSGVLESCMTLAWMVVAFGIGYLASVEKRGRIKLATAHAELLATQQLLADTLRVSERVRISRNLHDAIGHHLTALNLHLDLGLRQAGAQALESFHISRKLAQGLLEEVRGVVNIEREDRIICLREALDILCSGVPAPRIALSYDETIEIDDPALAHVIFRSVQEAITNAMRHSDASEMNVCLTKQTDSVVIAITDNGKGAHKLAEGNGLRGMRERIEELRGTLAIMSGADGRGFGLQIRLLQSGGAP